MIDAVQSFVASCGLLPNIMLEFHKVNNIVKRAASAVLKPRAGVRRVFSNLAADSEGHDALHVTIVLNDGDADRISGDMAVDALVEIGRALRDAGEDRLAIIFYATEQELASSGETEC